MRRRRLRLRSRPRTRIWRRPCPPWPSRSAGPTWTAAGSPGSAAIAGKPADQPEKTIDENVEPKGKDT